MAKTFTITKRTGQSFKVIVDDDKYDEVMRYTWHMNGTKYVCRMKDGRQFYLHWQIVGEPKPGEIVDHINGSGLDNRRDNLRHGTKAQNAQNRGRQRNSTNTYKGVTYNAEMNKWLAQIRIDNKTKLLGTYDTEKEAHAIYRLNADHYYGEFANYGKETMSDLEYSATLRGVLMKELQEAHEAVMRRKATK